MGIGKKIGTALQKAASSGKSVAKLLVESRRCTVSRIDTAKRKALIIMGNGPSLNDALENHAGTLMSHPLMAVNFAANTDEFYRFKPEFYVLADPIFFTPIPHVNTVRLWENFRKCVNWPMTLFVPARFVARARQLTGGALRIEGFNPVGVEGFHWLENMAFSTGLGMPRPRNVLIVAIMVATKMGFKEIYLTGADHSWSRTLEVDENNTVISVQPHFYKDNDAEHSRVASVYKNVRLHEIMFSFHLAFKAYFAIERFASRRDIRIYNASPGSFIDAFPRRSLPDE